MIIILSQKIKAEDKPEELSKREMEILTFIAAEKKTHEIAEILQISVNTVERTVKTCLINYM